MTHSKCIRDVYMSHRLEAKFSSTSLGTLFWWITKDIRVQDESRRSVDNFPFVMSLSLDGDTKPLSNKVVLQDDNPELSPQLSPEGLSPAGDSPQSDLPGVNKHHLDEIIPTTHSHRTIILCFDGTGDQFSEDVRTTFLWRNTPADVSQNSKNSNIVQFFSMLRKDNKSEQMVYYQVRRFIFGQYTTVIKPYTMIGRYWNVYDSGNRDSFHGQGFKDAGYDAR